MIIGDIGSVYPKLYSILYEEKGNFSTAELWKEFRTRYECSVSLREFKEWLVVMKLEQQQVSTWNMGMEHAVTPTPQQPYIEQPVLQEIEEMNYKPMVQGPPPPPTDPDIQFDNQ